MLRLLFCLLFASYIIEASALSPKEQGRLCDDFLYKFAFPSTHKFKPPLKKIISTLGDGASEVAYVHKYFWHDLEVIFLNNKYIDHAGFLDLDKIPHRHHKVTPEDIIAYNGKPINITQHHSKMKVWYCHGSASKLVVIFNDADQISRYNGRYCSQLHTGYCKDFIYSVRER